jgi:hypothetical protein
MHASVSALARVRVAASSILAALSLLPGCLVDDPPAYTAPQRTAPRIVGTRAVPALDQIIPTNEAEVVPFAVPVISEDAGETVTGKLFLNFADQGFEPIDDTRLPASTIDEGERTLRLSWVVRSDLKPGCHRVTLRVSHTSNFGNGPAVQDPSDVDEVYWFANVNVTPANANVLVACPSGGLTGSDR